MGRIGCSNNYCQNQCSKNPLFVSHFSILLVLGLKGSKVQGSKFKIGSKLMRDFIF
jgi:hypothetical protein